MALTFKNTQAKTSRLNEVKTEEILSAKARREGLREMLRQLDALGVSEDYDDEFFAPTLEATHRVRDFLETASKHLKTPVPLGTVYADGVGGVRVEWIRPDQELRFVVSRLPDERQYIYHEQGEEYEADYSPDPFKLSEWLTWLKN